MSRARIGEARGDPEAVLAALEPVRRFPFRDAVDEPGFWAWPDLYAEALVAIGRAEEADELLGPHEERAAAARAARRRSPGWPGRAGRVEAAPGRAEQAEAAFARALDAVGERRRSRSSGRASSWRPGEFLRRAGQRRRAAELLTAAQQGSPRSAPRPYAERCATRAGRVRAAPEPPGPAGTGRADRRRSWWSPGWPRRA